MNNLVDKSRYSFPPGCKRPHDESDGDEGFQESRRSSDDYDSLDPSSFKIFFQFLYKVELRICENVNVRCHLFKLL